MSNGHEIWSITYERQAITLLFLGFGLVGMDRFMVMPLFPSMMKDLGLTYQDLGLITGALSVAWGVSAETFPIELAAGRYWSRLWSASQFCLR